MSFLTDGNLLPFRQYDESNVINMFALNATGLNGQLVTIEPTAQDPAATVAAYAAQAPNGVSFTNVGNYQYLVPRRVRPAAATDSVDSIIGITLHTTATQDENRNLLVNQPYERTIERGFVQTGFAVPIATRGLFTVKLSNIVGTPLPGYAVTAAAGGALGVTAVTDLPFLATGRKVVGKWISSSGSAFGGYAQFLLTL